MIRVPGSQLRVPCTLYVPAYIIAADLCRALRAGKGLSTLTVNSAANSQLPLLHSGREEPKEQTSAFPVQLSLPKIFITISVIIIIVIIVITIIILIIIIITITIIVIIRPRVASPQP